MHKSYPDYLFIYIASFSGGARRNHFHFLYRSGLSTFNIDISFGFVSGGLAWPEEFYTARIYGWHRSSVLHAGIVFAFL